MADQDTDGRRRGCGLLIRRRESVRGDSALTKQIVIDETDA